MLFVSLSQFSLKSENGWTHMDKAQKPEQPFLPGIAECGFLEVKVNFPGT